MRTRPITTFAVALFTSFAASQSLSPDVKKFVKFDAPTIAIIHARLIDGTGAPARDDQTVILSQGKIQSVGPAASTNPPAAATIIDAHNETLIPGLVGMHDHLFYPMGNGIFGEMGFSFPRMYLAGGVTTIRTTGSLEPYTDIEIKKEIDSGKTPGPDDAAKVVNYWLDTGVDNFKAYMFITHAELQAAVDAAHKRHAKVTGHLCSIGFREAAQIGIDDLEHGLLVDTEFFPEKKPDTCPDLPDEVARIAKLDINTGPAHDMIVDLVQHHVAVTSTLPVFEMFVPGRPQIQPRVLDALAPDARTALLANKTTFATAAYFKKRYGTETSPWTAAFKKEMEFEYAFAKAGGLLLAGLDPTGMGGVLAGFGDQREVELLVEAGFTPIEAIHIATQNGAEFLGEADRIGTIAPGKQADLVLIKGDPSQKIEDIENVETVFKDGIGYDPTKLLDSIRGVVGLR